MTTNNPRSRSKKSTVKVSPPLPLYRKAVIKALRIKIDKETTAIEIEDKIWQMCTRLSEEYEDNVVDIYNKYAFEKTGCILAAESRKDREKVIRDIDHSVLDWDSSNYDEFRRHRDLDNAQIAEGVKIEKGEFKCRNRDCKSNECYFYQSQDRSSDEGSSTYVVCTKCSTRYRFN